MENKNSYKEGDYVLTNTNKVVMLGSSAIQSTFHKMFTKKNSSNVVGVISETEIVRKANPSEMEKYKMEKDSHKFNL